MNQGHFNAEKANADLRERYNIHFVDLFIKYGYTVYLFGGSLRDMVLGKDWKDADIRAWIPLPPNERDQMAEKILKEAGIEIKSKIIFSEQFTIYRFLPAGSKSSGVIDFTVVTDQFGVIPDFTMNGLYYDIGAKQLIDKHDSLDAIHKRVIRTVLPPNEQFKAEPHMIYRAIKCACQFGFTLEENILQEMRHYAELNSGTLALIADNTFEGMTEWFLANTFRGIKYNPHEFVRLWNVTGLTKVFIDFIAERLSMKPSTTNIPDSIFAVDESYAYEYALSKFISTVVDTFDVTNGPAVFQNIIALLRIDRPSVYGDFVVDGAQIRYIKAR